LINLTPFLEKIKGYFLVAKMGIRHTYYGVLSDVGIEPETVKEFYG
jgi:hypothetical protein